MILDAGNLFFKKELLDPGSPMIRGTMTAEIIVDAFNKIGCHAFSPGSKDFAAGLTFLQKMQKQAKFPFISANIMDINGNRIFDPYLIENIDGVKVGIIGVASKFVHSEVYIQDPLEAISELVDEVDSQSDFLVLMFDSEEADHSRLQLANYPVDLLIRSKSKQRSQDGGNKRIPAYSCGDRGKYLYQFDVTISKENSNFVDLALFENKITRANKQLERMKQGNTEIVLREFFKDDPQSIRKIDNYESQIESAKKALQGNANTIYVTKHELGKTVIDRPDVLALVESRKSKINKIVPPGPQPQRVPHDHDGDGVPDH
tara:strand:- start:110 stop:1060 length:951 start_codon:yes stop_codon:yes gene_type:complete